MHYNYIDPVSKCNLAIFLTEFCDWKTTEEKRSCASFIKTHHRQDPSSGSFYQVYKCNRDGTYTSNANKRTVKGTRSCKIGGCCPAMIKFTRLRDTTCEIVYWKQHFGHNKEIGQLRLPLQDRNSIKGKYYF